MSAQARDANWIDGLRGMASLFVVIGHLCTSFAPHLHAPAPGLGVPPTLFQQPFLRLCVSGRTAVALFFIITGYVNSIGPLSKANAGNYEGAFASTARSALARTGRLILPVALATVISWALANVGAYSMAEFADSTWIKQGHHPPAATWFDAFLSLTKAEIGTWTEVWNENYDGTQWTLVLFLEGSMLVYLTILSTTLVTPKARKIIFVAVYVYGWLSAKTAIKTMNISIGMLLADLHVHHSKHATQLFPGIVPIIFITLGALFACFPQDGPELAHWSEQMRKFMFAITPFEADLRRYWDSIGATFLIFGIFFSSPARRILSSPVFNFLGRVSFPVYLLHNQLIKTVLTWLVYFPAVWNPQFDKQGKIVLPYKRGNDLSVFAAAIIFFYVLYKLAWYWTIYIDPAIARIVRWGCGLAYREGVSDKGEKLNLLG
ncbi:hypothetical protein EJ08DRAFT_228113 [Tothia fuscella]|uniref:Acyltransferase 3 domain-containing protein n=1 Tax=Tothia fuscella TaxID=1048955 RepID=A0A9P4P0W0_9PEZI|nr:hypothetical protein EJ08DRAFT_228113 [Tothia fuscella]